MDDITVDDIENQIVELSKSPFKEEIADKKLKTRRFKKNSQYLKDS